MKVLGRRFSDIRQSKFYRVSERDIGIAIHEASHAVVALALGYRVASVEINKGSGLCTLVTSLVDEEHAVTWLLAGFAGDREFSWKTVHLEDDAYSQDLADVREWMPGITQSKIYTYILRAERLLRSWQFEVDELASNLLDKRYLDTAAIEEPMLEGRRNMNGPDLANHWRKFPEDNKPYVFKTVPAKGKTPFKFTPIRAVENKPKSLDYRTVVFDTRSSSKTGEIRGYASHFNSIDSYGTAVKKGAFAQTIAERGKRVPVLWNHNNDIPIGHPTVLREDEYGLYFKATIVEGTQAGSEIMELLRAGTPLGMSFGFETLRSRPVEDGDNLDWSHAPEWFKSERGRNEARVIEEVRLWEISVVTFPANEMATIDHVRWHGLKDISTTSPNGQKPKSRDLDRQVQVALASARLAGLIDWEPGLPKSADLDCKAAVTLASARASGLIGWSV